MRRKNKTINCMFSLIPMELLWKERLANSQIEKLQWSSVPVRTIGIFFVSCLDFLSSSYFYKALQCKSVNLVLKLAGSENLDFGTWEIASVSLKTNKKYNVSTTVQLRKFLASAILGAQRLQSHFLLCLTAEKNPAVSPCQRGLLHLLRELKYSELFKALCVCVQRETSRSWRWEG